MSTPVPTPSPDLPFRTCESGLVSVIVPTYNRAHLVTGAIDSILAQTYRRFEIIVVDDGSTDETRKILGPYMDRIRYVHQPNMGPGAARNTGLSQASGEWAAFLDSDDRWLADKLENQINFARRSGVRVIFTAVLWQTGPEVPQRPALADRDAAGRVFNEPFELILDETLPNLLPSLLVDRRLLQKVGAFDERFPRGEDNIMIFRLAFEGPFGYLASPQVIVDRVPGADSLTRNRLDPATLLKELFVSILIRSEAYFRLNGRAPHIARSLRRQLGGYMAQIAVLHCLSGNGKDARRFAADGFHFALRGKDRLKCVAVLLFPFLVRRWGRSRLSGWCGDGPTPPTPPTAG